MSLGSYPDIQIFPRVGVFEGFFWPPCPFLVYLPYSMHAFLSLFSLGYPMVTQPLQNDASLGSNPRGVPYLAVVVVLLHVLRFTLSIYLFLIKFGVWSFVRTQTISSMLHVLFFLLPFGRNMPSIVQNFLTMVLRARGAPLSSIRTPSDLAVVTCSIGAPLIEGPGGTVKAHNLCLDPISINSVFVIFSVSLLILLSASC